MPILGYFVILSLFVGMIVLCFFWGVLEFKKPKDPGPLFIDLDRTVEKRENGRECNGYQAPTHEHSVHSGDASILIKSSESTQNSIVHETIRVRGDLRIPKGELIPYNMIVEGNLISQEDVTFQGGIHVKGRAVIGARNRLEKSIVCQKDLLILEDVVVLNCVDCEGLLFIKKGVNVGVGVEGGGIASARTIYLENAEGPLRIHSKEGIHIVGTFKEVLPEDWKQIIEVETS